MATMASESHIAVGSNSVCTIIAANLGTVTANKCYHHEQPARRIEGHRREHSVRAASL